MYVSHTVVLDCKCETGLLSQTNQKCSLLSAASHPAKPLKRADSLFSSDFFFFFSISCFFLSSQTLARCCWTYKHNGVYHRWEASAASQRRFICLPKHQHYITTEPGPALVRSRQSSDEILASGEIQSGYIASVWLCSYY